MVFTVEIDNGTSRQTILNDVKWNYKRYISDFGEFEMVCDGTVDFDKSLFVKGNTILFFKDGVLDFKGQIAAVVKASGGMIALTGFSQGGLSRKEQAPNTTWTSTNASTIASAIISESVLAAGTINSGPSLDFRSRDSEYVHDKLKELSTDTGMDWIENHNDGSINSISFLTHAGSPTSVKILNNGIDLRDLEVTQNEADASKVVVYGKGDGNQQIKGTAGSGSQVKVVNNNNVISTSQANALAQKVLDVIEAGVDVYSFKVDNPYINLDLGDVITINSDDHGVEEEDLRVTTITRGKDEQEYYTKLQVVTKDFRRAIMDRNSAMSALRREANMNSMTMGGSGNTLHYSEGINAKSTAAHRNIFYLPEKFIKDEAGNLRVSDMDVTFDIEPFRRNVGTATESDRAPNINDSVTSTAPHNHNPNDSGHLHGNPSNTSNNSPIGGTGAGGSGVVSGVGVDTTYSQIVSFTYTGNSARQRIYRFQVGIATRTGAFDDWVYLEAEQGSRLLFSQWYYLPDNFGLASALFPFNPLSVSWGSTARLYGYTQSGACTVNAVFECIAETPHNHGISSFNSNSNNASINASSLSPNVSGSTINHNHAVGVSDDVTDSGSVNSTSVNLRLDHWNGSSWVEKHNFGTIATTKGEDIDLTQSGSYPDAPGYWRVRITPNSASPDYIRSLIEIKHSLDN